MIVGSLPCLGRRVVLFLVHSDGCPAHGNEIEKYSLEENIIQGLSPE